MIKPKKGNRKNAKAKIYGKERTRRAKERAKTAPAGTRAEKELGLMGTILFIIICFFCFVAYLAGYCAGSCDKQKEMVNKYSLIR